MAGWRRWLAWALVSAVMTGCGDRAAKTPEQPAPASGPPPVAAPAMGAGVPIARPAARAQDSSAAAGSQELLQFVPENFKLAAGGNLAALVERNHPLGARLVAPFQTAVTALARAGIRPEQVEKLWGGIDREAGDILICVRTKGNYDVAAATAGLGASGMAEKIGKATVYNLSAHPACRNAVAFVDARTLLVGRYHSVAAGLRNPRPGRVRQGIEAMNRSDAHFWVAGDGLCLKSWFGAGGIAPLESLATEALPLRGMAVGFRGPGEAPPAGSAAPPLELALGLSFSSEAAAISFEKRLNQMLKSPEQEKPAAAGPRPRRRDREKFLRFAGGSADDDDDRQSILGRFRAGAEQNVAVNAQSAPGIVRSRENVQIALSLSAWDHAALDRIVSDAWPALGAAAVSDGLFEGTLSSLDGALQHWRDARTGRLQGARRIGELPLYAGYSWMTELLPFLGRQDVYAQFDFNKSWWDPENRPLTATVIPAFLNPSDPRSTWNGYPEQFNGMALTHFAGMAGVEESRNAIAAELPRSDPRAGIFGYGEVARLAEVTDGTSQTIMLIGSGEVTAPWVQAGGATIRGARAPYFHKLSGFGSRGLAAPGAYVLFADGSARAIAATIDDNVFRALCTMHGAEQVDMAKLKSPGQD